MVRFDCQPLFCGESPRKFHGGELIRSRNPWDLPSPFIPGLVNVYSSLWKDPPCYENGKTHYKWSMVEEFMQKKQWLPSGKLERSTML